MNERILTETMLQSFAAHLRAEEKSPITIEKYLRDVRRFMTFASGRPMTRQLAIDYKQNLIASGYSVASVNSMLASLSSLLRFLSWADCQVRSLRRQRQVYCPPEKELTREEYLRLLQASAEQPQLNLLLQTICGTGIRISELKYFTVEAVQQGEVVIRCKNKTRTVLLPSKLRKLLLRFARRSSIVSGPVFVTRTGRPLNRSNVWTQMKKLCVKADVASSKVFPHNLRKLFAKTYYNMVHDIAKLADMLGHSSIDTTRIYIMTSGSEHRRQIEKLGLVV